MSRPTDRLPTGKVPAALLARLFARGPRPDARVLLGPRVGEDAAVIAMGDKALVVASDPITFATDAIGWYAVQVNANDVATRGAAPRWFLAVVLLPEAEATPALTEAIFDQLYGACSEVGATLVGGHTEVTHGLDRPVVIGVMLGEVAADRLIVTGGARPGDAVLLTKGIAIEGTAILARERAALLEARGHGAVFVREAQGLLKRPGISVLAEALSAAATPGVTAMHDPTEGGLAEGLYELAEAAGAGIRVDEARIAVLPETATVCRELGLDPLGTIASGALLITCRPEAAEGLGGRLEEAGIACAAIGEVTDAWRGVRTVEGAPLRRFPRDEVARFFEAGERA